MDKVFTILLNALWFYFLVDVINGIEISQQNLSVTILISVVAGMVMWSVNPVLRFFKISVNTWSRLFLAVVFSFIFFFAMYLGVLSIGSVGPSIIDLGIVEDSIITLDPIGTLLVSSFTLGIGSIGLKLLSKA